MRDTGKKNKVLTIYMYMYMTETPEPYHCGKDRRKTQIRKHTFRFRFRWSRFRFVSLFYVQPVFPHLPPSSARDPILNCPSSIRPSFIITFIFHLSSFIFSSSQFHHHAWLSRLALSTYVWRKWGSMTEQRTTWASRVKEARTRGEGKKGGGVQCNG